MKEQIASTKTEKSHSPQDRPQIQADTIHIQRVSSVLATAVQTLLQEGLHLNWSRSNKGRRVIDVNNWGTILGATTEHHRTQKDAPEDRKFHEVATLLAVYTCTGLEGLESFQMQLSLAHYMLFQDATCLLEHLRGFLHCPLCMKKSENKARFVASKHQDIHLQYASIRSMKLICTEKRSLCGNSTKAVPSKWCPSYLSNAQRCFNSSSYTGPSTCVQCICIQ